MRTAPTTAPAPPPRRAGLEDAYRSHWPGLVRLGHLLTGSRAAGEDLAQEAFVGLLRRTAPVDDPGAYLRRSVVNAALTARARRAREQRFAAGLREDVVLPPEVDETWRALSRLPARQRAVLVLRYYEDLSESDIAAALGCRPGTVKSLASRGLARLRKEIDR
jgi:RNA polymerase sigma factor (sigma-70 family)